jgi:hypothetical protein
MPVANFKSPIPVVTTVDDHDFGPLLKDELGLRHRDSVPERRTEFGVSNPDEQHLTLAGVPEELVMIMAPLAVVVPDTWAGVGIATSCRIAGTLRERVDAFGLVYRRYREAELIEPNPYRLRVTPYHLLPTTNTFIAVENSRTICTVTLIGDGELGLPMESIYRDEILACRRRNLYVGEVSCLAFEPMDTGRFLMVFMQLTRLMAQHARSYGMDQFVIAVHPQHARFYQRFMGMEQVGPLKTYPSVQNAPAVACCLDFAAIDRTRPKCWDSYFGSRLPESAIRSRPMGDNEISYFQPVAEYAGAPAPHAAFPRNQSFAPLPRA